MKLRRRIQLLFIPFLVLLALDVGFDRYLVLEWDRSLDRIEDRLDPALAAVAELQQALVDQSAGQRGYLITGQDRFLESYRQARVRTEEVLGDLESLVPEGSNLDSSVGRVQARIQEWQDLALEAEIRAEQAGDHQAAAAMVASGRGQALFDDARLEAVGLTRLLDDERVRLTRRTEVLRSRLAMSRFAGLAVGATMVLGAGWLLIRWIGRPLHQIGSAVEAVAGGDLDRAIPAPGPPDLAQLARRVEAMRLRILHELDDASRAREALARRGMVVLTLRDELVPDGAHLPDGVFLGAGCVPAEGVVAGDWYDIVRVADHRLALALVDVSGHGAEAAVFALKTKQLLLSSLRAGHEPAQSLSWLADQLQDTDERFLTGVVMVVDASAGTLTYASAGHPPLLLTGPGGASRRLDPTGPLLGPLAGNWGQSTLSLAPGDLVTAYSDGMIEAVDELGQELGIDGLEELVARSRHLEGPHLVERCLDEVRRRTNHRHDDLTMVVVGLGQGEARMASGGSEAGG